MKFQIKIHNVKELFNGGLEITVSVRTVDKGRILFQGVEHTKVIMKGDSLSFDLDRLIIFPELN